MRARLPCCLPRAPCSLTLFSLLVSLRLSLRLAQRVCWRWATLMFSIWAMRPARAATARARRGGWWASCFSSPWQLAVTSAPSSTSMSPASRPGPPPPPSHSSEVYTDMLGCSMSRFSRGLASTLQLCFCLAVKQGGGVRIQPSAESWFDWFRKRMWRCPPGLAGSGVDVFCEPTLSGSEEHVLSPSRGSTGNRELPQIL